jgi:serine/threonine protein kinase
MLVAGTQLGPYKILASLGAGGMGEVYCAEDVRLERLTYEPLGRYEESVAAFGELVLRVTPMRAPS